MPIFVGRMSYCKHNLAALLLLLFSYCLVAHATKWNANNIPMVYLQDATQYVCNPDDVLSSAAVAEANATLGALERDKGVQTIVVVVKQLDGDDPYSFGMQLAKKYGIGSKKQRTGLIVVLATEDRSYQILTGNGLEGTLPDGICRRIQNQVMVPALKQGDWDGAIVKTLKSIDGYVRGDNSLTPDDEDDDAEAMIAGAVMVVSLIVLWCVLSFFHRKRCPKCGKRMKRVQQQKVKLKGSQRIMLRSLWVCKNCGYQKTEYSQPDDDVNNSGGVMPPIFFGGGSTGHSSGGSFGGTFGGGTFGGGGSGGRF